MKTSIQMISLGSHELLFLLDHQHQPMIEVKNVQYQSLNLLLHTFPQLQHKSNLEKLAQIANFLTKGMEFQYIENIDSFKISYEKQMKEEQSSLEDERLSLKNYGVFDLSIMHPPSIKNHMLVFFVQHDYLKIPYQVSVIFLSEDHAPEILYELLPYES